MQDLIKQLKRETEILSFYVSCIEEAPEMYQEAVKTHAKIEELLLRISDRGIDENYFRIKESTGPISIDIKEDEVDVYLPCVINMTRDSRAIIYRDMVAFFRKKYLSKIDKKLSEFTSPHYGEKHVFWLQFNGWPGDVDNLEIKVLIDFICGHFVPDDTCSYVSIYRTASPEGEIGTTLRIMPESRFKKEIAR